MIVDKKRLFRTLCRKLWLIILVAFLSAVLSFGITRYLIKPEYTASAKFYVNNSAISVGSASISISSSELSAAQSLVETYIVILNSRMTLTEVQSTSKLDYTYEELREMISAESANGTEIFEVTVTTTNPESAAKIANTIAVILPSKIAAVVEGSSVRVVDYAVVPTRQSSPGTVMNTALGLLFGGVFSVTVIIFREMLDRRIRSEERLHSVYPHIPVLAVIPDSPAARSGGYYG